MKTDNEPKAPIIWSTTLLLLLTPIISVVGGIWYQIAYGFEWYHFAAFVFMAAITGISITGGYHRLWAHKAYSANIVVRWFFALFGAANYQNSILVWASQHRRHHFFVDDNDKDPYSANKGLWFSHVGWLLRDYPNNKDDFTNCKDLQKDPVVVIQHKYYFTIAFLMNIVPPLLLGAITGDYIAFFLTMAMMKLVYTHHTTFFINSLAHFWGKRPYTTENTARDNGMLAFFTYGEGYHNYHHKFQNDYRNGIRWYQYDPTKWMIRVFSVLGLAKDLKRTPNIKIREAMVKRQLERATETLATNQKYQALSEYVEKEAAQFAQTMTEWKQTQSKWFALQRGKLESAKQDLRQNMENSVVSSRMKELEYTVLMQYQRLRQFNAGLA